MKELLEFTFSGFWTFCGVLLLIELVLLNVFKVVMFMWNRFWRHFNIRKHGYPPSHCDADGDFK
jgi:hypothetical protein